MNNCPADKDYNPKTKRCVKKCPEGKIRDASTFKCKKDPDYLKPCKDGKERNPVTKKCVKKCKEGSVRNPETGKCVKQGKTQKNTKKATTQEGEGQQTNKRQQREKTPAKDANTPKAVLPGHGKKVVNGPEDCPPGTVFNPKTKRCNKEKIPIMQKPCPEGKVRNPKTGRCISLIKLQLLNQQNADDEVSSIVIHPPTKGDMQCALNSKLTLKDYQKRLCQFMDTNRGVIVAHGVGSGKTLSAVTVSQCFLEKNPDAKVIVSTPKSLISNFKKEMETYGIKSDDPRYVFYTHDGLCNLIKFNRVPLTYFNNNLLIVDEIHNFRTQPLEREDKETGKIKYSQSYYAIKAAHASAKVLGLTATPIVNAMADLKNPLSMITGKLVKKMGVEPTVDGLEKYKSLFSVFQRDQTDPDYPSKNVQSVDIKMTSDYYRKYMKIEEFLKNKNKAFVKKFYLSLRMAVNKLDNTQRSPKVLWTIDLIKNGLKTLVYSGFKDSGVLYIAKNLDDLKIPYAIISGDKTIAERKQIVEDYNNNKLQVLLITRAGGEGLDLKETRQVVLFEPVWNPSTEEQIVGRAVRKGSHSTLRKKDRHVEVYKLLMVTPSGEDTVDHVLTGIINEKIELVTDAVQIMKELSIELQQCFE
jgi:SNF2 family DNA or RNA helicase